MSCTRSVLIAALVVSAIMLPNCSTQQKKSAATSDTTSNVWVPIAIGDWGVYTDMPNYHFALAKGYLQKGDYSKAASELKLANSFLFFQNYRLAAASKQIDELTDSIAAGKYKDINKLDAVTANVIKIIDNKYAIVPVETRAYSVFDESYKYHFEKAKSKLQENDRAGAASEIRRAAAFLRLEAVHSGHIVRAELDSSGSELSVLAYKVESGAVKDTKELDRILQDAKQIISGK